MGGVVGASVGGVVGVSVGACVGGVVGSSVGAVVGSSVGGVVGSSVGACVPSVPSVGFSVLPVVFSVPLVVDGLESLGSVAWLSPLLQAHRLSNMTKAKSIASAFFIVVPFLSIK